MVPPAGAWVLNGVAWRAGVSGDPGGSGVVGVGTCNGCGCGGALGVGSVYCAWGSGERTADLAKHGESGQIVPFLQSIKGLSKHIHLTPLMQEMTQPYNTLLKAERCTIFLMEKEKSELTA